MKSVPRSALTPGALTSSSPISSQYALATIFTGERIVAAVGLDRSDAVLAPDPDPRVAVGVQLGDPARVAEFVEPGREHRRLQYARRLDASSRPRRSSPGPDPTLASAAGSDASGTQNTEQLPKALVTLALDQKDAQKLIYALAEPVGVFALLSGTSKVQNTGNPTNQGNLYN